jgi:hypothetical protein
MPHKTWGRRCSNCGTPDRSEVWDSAADAHIETRKQDDRPWYQSGRRWACPNCGSRLYTVAPLDPAELSDR